MPRGKFDSTNQKHYPDVGGARHQYGISALVSQTSFGGETSGSVAKCRLFSQAKSKEEAEELTQTLLVRTSIVIVLFWVSYIIRSQVTDSIDGNVRGTQRLFSVK